MMLSLPDWETFNPSFVPVEYTRVVYKHDNRNAFGKIYKHNSILFINPYVIIFTLFSLSSYVGAHHCPVLASVCIFPDSGSGETIIHHQVQDTTNSE